MIKRIVMPEEVRRNPRKILEKLLELLIKKRVITAKELKRIMNEEVKNK